MNFRDILQHSATVHQTTAQTDGFPICISFGLTLSLTLNQDFTLKCEDLSHGDLLFVHTWSPSSYNVTYKNIKRKSHVLFPEIFFNSWICVEQWVLLTVNWSFYIKHKKGMAHVQIKLPKHKALMLNSQWTQEQDQILHGLSSERSFLLFEKYVCILNLDRATTTSTLLFLYYFQISKLYAAFLFFFNFRNSDLSLQEKQIAFTIAPFNYWSEAALIDVIWQVKYLLWKWFLLILDICGPICSPLSCSLPLSYKEGE